MQVAWARTVEPEEIVFSGEGFDLEVNGWDDEGMDLRLTQQHRRPDPGHQVRREDGSG
jgi:hypothetical protein